MSKSVYWRLRETTKLVVVLFGDRPSKLDDSFVQKQRNFILIETLKTRTVMKFRSTTDMVFDRLQRRCW